MEKFVARQHLLLDRESAAEEAEFETLCAHVSAAELQRRGVALLHLQIGGMRTGLGGHTHIELVPNEAGAVLPAHQLRPGDLVELAPMATRTASAEDAPAKFSGVVFRVRDASITIGSRHEDASAGGDGALADAESAGTRFWRLTRVTSDVSFKRMRRAIDTLVKPELSRFSSAATASLARILLGEAAPGFHEAPFVVLDEKLDSSQKRAVAKALAADSIAVIHGPPGTGKTQTVVEVIRQLVQRGERVLACAPSNVAVDNLVERLRRHGLDLVRIGSPARILETVLPFCLDARIPASDAGRLVADVRREMDSTLARMRKAKSRGDRRALQDELRALRGELKQRERAAVESVVGGAQVVLGTLVGIGGRVLEQVKQALDARDAAAGSQPQRQWGFDTVVIDEAGQALEAECWIGLTRAKRVILAGDHLQLPPTVKSDHSTAVQSLLTNGASAKRPLELSDTLLERVLALHGDGIRAMLETQYRANSRIMEYSSAALYDGRLLAHSSVAEQVLAEMPGVADNETTRAPLVFYDTAGFDLWEQADDAGERGNGAWGAESKLNRGEADLVREYIDELLGYGVSASDVALITPYNGQVGLLRSIFRGQHPGMEIGSVDGFQGREKPIVIISLVRSNADAEIGFLADARRLNVAVTRAQRQVVLVCDSETVSERGRNKFMQGLIDHFSEHGELRVPSC